MGMKSEKDVKAAVRKLLEATAGCWYFMPAANGFGRAGIPDFVGMVRGFGFAVETKFGSNQLTPAQRREVAAIAERGGKVWVVTEKNVGEWTREFVAWATGEGKCWYSATSDASS